MEVVDEEPTDTLSPSEDIMTRYSYIYMCSAM